MCVHNFYRPFCGRTPAFLLLLLTITLQPNAARAAFTDIGAALGSVSNCSLAWGDYDNDGDLDLALAGIAVSGGITKIYRNDGGTFSDSGVALVGVYNCSLAWGDYDNDGDLDLALAGDTGSGYISKIHRNDNGSFSDSGAALVGVYYCSLAWGDYDNDGDLDLALAGETGSGRTSKIYQNGNGSFSDSGAALVGVNNCSLAWADYDNDGDLDLALAGDTGSGRIAKIHRNEGGSFIDSGAALVGVNNCSLAWGDYDNDGDLDLALAGDTGSGRIAKIHRNEGGSFSDSGAALVGVYRCSLAWGDYDNDGDLDLVLAGNGSSGSSSKLYRNDNGSFADSGAALVGVSYCSLAWGDYDNDGYLDLALAGFAGSGRVSKIYRNGGGWGTEANTPPGPPLALGAQTGNGVVTLSWDSGSDDQTPAAGLSYNLMVGGSEGGVDVVSPMSFTTTDPGGAFSEGRRKIAAQGQKRGPWASGETGGFTLNGLAVGQYWWGVQAVDGGLAGSAFTTGTFTIVEYPVPSDFTVRAGSGAVIQFGKEQFAAVFQDPRSDPLLAVHIAALPGGGVLTLSGSAVTSGQEIAYADLDGLVFTPDAGWHGDTFFTWSGCDSLCCSTVLGTVTIGMGCPAPDTASFVRTTGKEVQASGSVADRGGSDVTDRGFVWAKHAAPTLADRVVPSGAGLGSFTEILGDMTGAGTFYCRAYATNASGTGYGQELTVTDHLPVVGTVYKTAAAEQTVTFTWAEFQDAYSDDPQDSVMDMVQITSLPAQGTLYIMGVPLAVGQVLYGLSDNQLTYRPGAGWHGNTDFTWAASDGLLWSDIPGRVKLGIGPPVVSTLSLTRQSPGSFLARGNVAAEGMGPVTDRGFLWCDGEGPYTPQSSGTGGLGGYETPVTGFAPGTFCWVKAFATNAGGTSYGQVMHLSASDPGTAAMSILLGVGVLNGTGPAISGTAGAVMDGSAAVESDSSGWSDNPDEEKKRLK